MSAPVSLVKGPGVQQGARALELGRALLHTPDDADLLCELAVLHRAAGRLPEAARLAARVPLSRTTPRQFQALLALGEQLVDAGFHATAAPLLHALHRHWPRHAGTNLALGHLSCLRREWAAAVAPLEAALRAEPRALAAHLGLGHALRHLGRDGEAEAHLREARAIDPSHAVAAQDLGAFLLTRARVAEALPHLQAATALAPGLVRAWMNLGLALREAGELEASAAAYRRGLELEPRHAMLQVHLCFVLLAAGRLREAWPWIAARRAPAALAADCPVPRVRYPEWKGQPLAGRSLLLWPEQGHGDFLQFIRFAPVLKASGLAHLTVVCRPSLARLAREVEGVDQVRTVGQRVPRHDFWVMLMDVPHRLGLDLGQLPATLPYLQAPPAARKAWQGRLPRGRVAGLAWRGAELHQNDSHRSLPGLPVLAPLWSVPGWRFASLQKGAGEAEAREPPPGQPLLALGDALQDFADTAAAVEALDLVICVDTAVAHLAGALGKPVWVLLPAFGTDWRWMQGRTDSPWYPGVMRLFRQPTPGQWDDVVAEVADALREWPGD